MTTFRKFLLNRFIHVFALIFLLLLSAKTNANWQLISTLTYSYTDMINDGDVFYVTSQNHGVYKSTNAGSSWFAVNNGLSGDALYCDKIILSQNKLMIATMDGIYISSNGGSDWIKKSIGLPIGPGANNIYAHAIFEDGSQYLAGTFIGVFRSTDNCETWTPTSLNSTFNSIVSFIRYDNILFAGRDGSSSSSILFKSTNNGLNWTSIPIGQNTLGVLCFFPENDKLIAGLVGGLYESTNSGANWISMTTDFGSDPYVFSIVKSSGIYFLSMGIGGAPVYKSTNNGANWVSAGEGMTGSNAVHKILIYNGKMYAAANGVFKRDLGELVGVQKIGSLMPNESELYQNYPNPFNPATKIKFNISSIGNSYDGLVQLKIYDILGNELQTLVNESLKPGSYEVTWDASNYATGTYFYKLVSGGFTQFKKLSLIK